VTLNGWDGLLWLLLLLGPLLILQRGLHREIQSIFLLITRRADISIILFSILFLPGVILHEGSHFIMATLLGVRTGRVSLIPKAMPGGKLQLGYVETTQVDFFRTALIGLAPLLSGGVVISLLGSSRLGLIPVGEEILGGHIALALSAIKTLPERPDFWVWFYLVFIISSTMLPSASDRRTWLPLGVALTLLVGLAALAGAGPWLAQNLAPIVNRALRSLAIVFAVSAAVHAVVLLPVWLARLLLNRITGLQVQ
jgi:hypothetical protein